MYIVLFKRRKRATEVKGKFSTRQEAEEFINKKNKDRYVIECLHK